MFFHAFSVWRRCDRSCVSTTSLDWLGWCSQSRLICASAACLAILWRTASTPTPSNAARVNAPASEQLVVPPRWIAGYLHFCNCQFDGALPARSRRGGPPRRSSRGSEKHKTLGKGLERKFKTFSDVSQSPTSAEPSSSSGMPSMVPAS